MSQLLPKHGAERKQLPIARGLLDYFPDACAYVSLVSKVGNDKHNPGQEMHHARGKSTDHADCIARHLVDRGKRDEETDLLHTGELAWRAMAMLQEELEALKLAQDSSLTPEDVLPRGAKLPELSATKHMQAEVAKEAEAQKRDAFIPWAPEKRWPGGIPLGLPASRRVVVKLRGESVRMHGPADSFVWTSRGEAGEVVAYRLAQAGE